MAKQGISTGTSPNDGTGDTLLSGAVKINANFDEIYTGISTDGVTVENIVLSSVSNIGGASTITNAVFISSAGYSAIASPDPNTLYVVLP
jgi:hypothetical protein